MKRSLHLLLAAVALLLSATTAYAARYQYDSIPGDPMHTRIYTLPNGLKMYMSVNKDEPRIQTNIAVRVGSKNDPAETTGLAHYFEHMMFKGSKDFGTSDYAAEKPMLDKIEQLFEVYRATTDSVERARIYHQIDSISYEASKIAIPNEYDKLMATIGANGTNAYTSYDMTCYVEDIPANELERWAMIQANRFEFPVLRGFHTELETIYEEKNMSLTKDSRKAYEALFAGLFPNHPYGQWSVLGHQQHLKNPSITNIKNYHKQWYVPNNMAILMSGDFDPDNAVDIVTKYFGHLKPNPSLPVLKFEKEAPITSPIEREVLGNEAEMLMMGWRFPAAADRDREILSVIGELLSNGQSGLMDIDINTRQKALGVGAGHSMFADYSMFLASGRPREGQSLEDVRDLILAEFAKLRAGEFDAEMLPAIVNWMDLSDQKAMETNSGRVGIYEDSFIYGVPLEEMITSNDRIRKITKQDIMDYAAKHLRDDNYVIIYKRQGKDPNELKIAKQPITPIAVNRDISSKWLEQVSAMHTEPIEPVFLDFEKDLTIGAAHSGRVPLYYTQNKTNDLFTLTYVLDTGKHADKTLGMLGAYYDYLGTPTRTTEQIADEMYKLACTYSVSIGGRRSYLVITGLSENMPKAMEIVEDLLQNAIPDTAVWSNVVARQMKARADSKSNQGANNSRLRTYAAYGPDQVKEMSLSDAELQAIDPAHLTEALKLFANHPHRVIYYGPMSLENTVAAIDAHHRVAPEFKPLPERHKYEVQQPQETVFFLAPYDSKQIYMSQFACDGTGFDNASEPMRNMFNEYFGGGMNSIVFQEMREARSLAYSAWAVLSSPSWIDDKEQFVAGIATQNDKMETAIEAFDDIIENMPRSDKAFNLAKSGIDKRLRTERIIKDNIAWTFINLQDLGLNADNRKAMFEALPSITLDDVVAFHDSKVKGRKYYYAILGDINDLDISALEKRGKVVILTTEDIFGY